MIAVMSFVSMQSEFSTSRSLEHANSPRGGEFSHGGSETRRGRRGVLFEVAGGLMEGKIERIVVGDAIDPSQIIKPSVSPSLRVKTSALGTA